MLMSVVALLTSTMPAGAAETVLMDLDITGVWVTASGGARVSGAYLCPSRPGTPAKVSTVVQVVQEVPDGDGYVYGDNIPFPATCDDLHHPFSVTFAVGRGGELFRPHRPIAASAGLSMTNLDGSPVTVIHRMWMRAGSLLSNVEIGGATFTGAGAIRVTGTYICPIGYTVDQTDARLEQLTGERPGTGRIRHFDRRVVCDGTWNEIAVRFRSRRTGEPLEPDLLNAVRLIFGAQDAGGQFLYAEDRDLTIIHA